MNRIVIFLGIILGISVSLYFLTRPKKEETFADRLKSATETKKEVSPKKTAEVPSDLPVPSESGPWPKAVVPEPTFVFGRMAVATENSHSFIIRNEGEADLKLKAGLTTCKCTTFGFGASKEAATPTATVKPGEEVALLMNWKSGEAPDRAFRHGGDVHTNDPKNPLLKIAVQGAIEQKFEILPMSRWDAGNIYDQPGRMKVGIGSKVHSSFEITSVESPSGMVTAKIQPMTEAELGTEQMLCGYSIELEVSTGIPSGYFEEVLKIATTTEKEPLRVTLVARKHGAIRLQQLAGASLDPKTLALQLGSFAANTGREAKLLVIVDEKDMKEPFAITKIEADPAFVTASLESAGPPSGTVHRYFLTIKVPPGRPHAQRTDTNPGRIKISTNHSSGDAISLGLKLYSN
ncbi:MAG: DUF1573 domain-containing protein [Planctomycetaceae bacterium]